MKVFVVISLIFLAVLAAFHWLFAACLFNSIGGHREFDEPAHEPAQDPAFVLHPERQFTLEPHPK
jgi:hypothetical protein